MKKVLEYPTLNRKQFPNLVVVGATASGKTTVAYQLARLIGFGVLDLDDWIEKKQGRRIEDIFAQEGEAAFRQMETEALEAIGGILNHIIIPGAGAVEREGMTLVPLKLYFNDKGRAKIEIALARGKKLHDKRETEKKRSWQREKGRLLRQRG